MTSANSGIIETVTDAVSLHNIKKNTPNFTSLLYFFINVCSISYFEFAIVTYIIQYFGEVHTENFKAAQRNFVESLAAYSIICYILQVKDRYAIVINMLLILS